MRIAKQRQPQLLSLRALLDFHREDPQLPYKVAVQNGVIQTVVGHQQQYQDESF